MQAKSNTSLFLKSLLLAFFNNKELANYFVNKHKINVNEDWVSTSKMVDTLFHVEEFVGKSTVQKIGATIAEIVSMPSLEEHSFHNFILHQLDDVYAHNHQLLRSGFKVNANHDGYFIDLSNNPYPLLFNKGLLSGFSFKHKALNRIHQIDKNILLIEKVI
jgi:hypothetical protein